MPCLVVYPAFRISQNISEYQECYSIQNTIIFPVSEIFTLVLLFPVNIPAILPEKRTLCVLFDPGFNYLFKYVLLFMVLY